MHPNGIQIAAALNQSFPHLAILAHESDYGNVLVLSFEHEGNMLCVQTPLHYDYRRYDYQRWVHQATDLIREKTR